MSIIVAIKKLNSAEQEETAAFDLCSRQIQTTHQKFTANLICISDSVCYCIEAILKLENDALSFALLFAAWSLKGSFPLLQGQGRRG